MLLGRDQESAVGYAGGVDPEALIREARRRTRRRRARRGVAVLLLAWVAAFAVLETTRVGPGVIGETASTPFANLEAFARQGRVAFVSRGALWVLDGGGGTLRRVPVPGGDPPSSPSFSRDGRWLAFLTASPTRGFPSPLTTIRAYPLDGRTPTTWPVARARHRLAGVCSPVCSGVTADLAGWWPGWGIAFWALPGSLAQTVDATALEVLASPGTTPRPGATGSAVSLDPAWSPSGVELAYIKAPATPIAENPTSAWYQAHQLFLWNARTGTANRIPKSAGAIVPTWSRDRRALLYVSDNGLWLTRLSGGQAAGRPAEIVHPLFPEQQWREVASNDLSFYGQIPWDAKFSWSSR